MSESDQTCFRRRAAQERHALDDAQSAEVASVHRLLAERYELLAERYPNLANGDEAASEEPPKPYQIRQTQPVADQE